MKGLSMLGSIFFDYFLKSLKFYLGNRCEDIEFIKFVEEGNNNFIVIEKYILETLVVLLNIFGKERIVFSCGIIYDEGVIAGVEVWVDKLELEKLNDSYRI